MGSLSDREMQVLRLTAWDCLSAKEVADKLNISPTTAQNHIKNIKEKLSLQKVSELCKHYYVNIYATILLLITLPSIFQPNGYVRQFRSRSRAAVTWVRRNEFDLTTI